jgi:hypothetical protein
MMRYLIHSTTDPETGKPLKDYYSQIHIPDEDVNGHGGAEFDVQYGPHHLRFKMVDRWITNERMATIELVTELPVSHRPIPKRPVIGEPK